MIYNKNIKRAICSCAIAIALVSTLTSCFFPDFKSYPMEYAEETIENVIISINKKDTVKFKSLFATNVCNDNSDLDENITELFKYVEGEITEYKCFDEINRSEKTNYGKRKKEFQATYLITTDEKEYYIAIRQCTVDDFDNSNIGIHTFNIISAEEWKSDYMYRVNVAQDSGIYIEETLEGFVS